MVRVLKLFSIVVAMAVVLSNCEPVSADEGGYTLGPYIVVGSGGSPAASLSDAYRLMNEKIAEVTAGLPEGHQIMGFTIIDEDWMSPYSYYIEFSLSVQSSPPPPPPGG